jgi:hypothetical protein
MTELEKLKMDLARAQSAFAQNPNPPLSTIVRRLAGMVYRRELKERKEKRNNSGRPAAGADIAAGYQVKKAITVDAGTIKTLQRLGAGNLSAGVRKAAGIVRTLKKEVDEK